MELEIALSDRESKAQRYGLHNRSRLAADACTAMRMARSEGLSAMLRHARAVMLIRLHAMMAHRIAARLPRDPRHRCQLDGLTIRSSSSIDELGYASASSAVPAKVFEWSVAGLEINHSHYDFVDLGSGRGLAVLLASRLRFRTVTGVEFAEEIHDDAVANISSLAQRQKDASHVTLVNASVLDYPFSNVPTVFFLYNPFVGPVMDALLDRLVRSLRAEPRPHRLLYLNPQERRKFEAREFVEVALRRRERMLISLLSPFDVRAYQLAAEGAP
jgi:hypothetical protein